MKECYADLEERGEYDGHGLVTPLWCAVATNKLEVVESLIELGANINAASAHGCTPVLSAGDLWSPEWLSVLSAWSGCSKAERNRSYLSHESSQVQGALPIPHR